MKKLKMTAAAACFALAAAILLPAAAGFFHLGLLYGVYFAAAGLLLWRPPRVAHLFGRCAWVEKMLLILCAAVFAVTVVLSGLMLRAALRPTADSGTVVILGCRADENGPSLMLRRRMDAAVGYLEAHPGSAVVATGAQGRGETMPESEAIVRYLLEKGVEPGRIYSENRSRNTDGNMKYAASVIAAQGLDCHVIIVSDGFHQYRAGLLAEKYGLIASPLSCRTPVGVAVTYWFREILGVLRFYVLNY